MGKRIADLSLPSGVIVAGIRRREELIIPRGDILIEDNDTIILGAEPYEDMETINLKEVVLREQHPWNGHRIKDIDISKHSVIVLITCSIESVIESKRFLYLPLFTKCSISLYTGISSVQYFSPMKIIGLA